MPAWVDEAGIAVLNQLFVAKGNVAIAGGYLASHYPAIWVIARMVGLDEMRSAIRGVTPFMRHRSLPREFN